MNKSDAQPGFSIWTPVACLAAATVICDLALIALLEDTPVRLIMGASLVCWLLAVAGLAPVAILGPRGVMPVVAGYFVGMSIRFLGSLCGYLAAIRVVGVHDAEPILITIAILYPLLLAIEVAFVGRYLWAKDFLPSTRAEATS